MSASVWTPDNSVLSATALAALLNNSDVALGDALLGTRLVATGATGLTQHQLNEEVISTLKFGDDADAIQLAIDEAYLRGGGTVLLTRGKVYTSDYLPVLKPGVTLDGNYARINATLGTGNVFGLRVVTLSKLKNIRIYVTSTGSPSSQFIFHAPVSVGAANNNGDSVASPDAYQTAYGWRIENVELSSTREFGPAIQIMGDSYGGEIDGVYIPASSTCSGIHADWGNVGTVSSLAIGTTKTDFLANQCYTTHPHNIKIRNVILGNLSVPASLDLGSSAVRLSACYAIECENVYAVSTTLTGYRHVGGDLGFEFARVAEKYHACKGNTVKNLVLGSMASTGTADGIWVDTLADNVYREQFLTGYVPLMNPLMHGSVVVQDCDLPGPNADNQYGVRMIQARGVTIRRNQFQRWKSGIWADEFCRDITIEDNDVYSNRESGIKVGFALLRENTRDITIRKNRVYGNGTASTGYGVLVTRGHNVKILDNTFGAADETIQAAGVVVGDNDCANLGVVLEGNHCEGATAAAWIIADASVSAPYAYRQVSIASNNTVASRVPKSFDGQAYVPLRSLESTAGLPCREWLNPNTAAPTDGTWYRGEQLLQTGAAAGAIPGHYVTTSGTFGTLSGLTDEATNSTNIVTMSLAARTASITAGSYSVVVSSATNLRAGLKCSIAAGGITNATILSVSGTTLQLDIPANATNAAAAFVAAGVIEGEVVSIDTATPIVGALVKKVSGTSVTISATVATTETGRTVTYTTPVFKALAAIAP